MNKPKILIVDDEINLTRIMGKFCEKEGYEPILANTGAEAISYLEKTEFDVAFIDINMPDISGFQILQRGKELRPNCYFIIMTATDNMENTIEAIKKGAYDYISKPFDLEEIKFSVEKIMRLVDLKLRVDELKSEIVGESTDDLIVGKSRQIREIFKFIGRVSSSDATVLITGESGTGKELVAKAIHYYSPRVGKQFIKVNCAAIPGGLVESELFGHKKGSFSGAYETVPGKFQAAEGGTIFLDEIAELDLSLQGKLLRVIQEKTIEPVGESKARNVDVRIIAATNKNLEEEVKKKTFRQDLFYRLNVFPVHLPPLRERKEDIPLLAEHFIKKYRNELSSGIRYITKEALDLLASYHWPGNVRELESTMLRAMMQCRNEFLSAEDIKASFDTTVQGKSYTFEDAVNEAVDNLLKEDGEQIFSNLSKRFEKAVAKRVMEKTGNNQSRTAEILGISRNTLRKILDKN
ncbi:MAG: sigma-54-dependent Fis family transcriptional regulator [Candidatus Schekmanbacteria bacterium]|nr:MAG: sigma-54-dependent Fis family transcriptional regulator [Candidatus Schekmanbacteria bacterium]